VEVNTRVIAATNRDLKAYTDAGNFREDLYYRLNVFPIHVPPLRDRREDIPALINHFITRFARRMDKDITRVERQTMERLMTYNWPGNVRELENIIERAMIVSRSDTLEIDTNWLSTGGQNSTDVTVQSESDHSSLHLSEVERQAILSALQHCHGKIYGPDGAALRLGLKPTTLYGKMRKHKIKARRTHGTSG
jgi:formate hydrogenlyase transcriptional activator